MNGLGSEMYITRGTSVLISLIFLTLKATVITDGHAVAPPRDVHFSSYNLRNVVQWRPGKGAGNGTRYTVQYAIYGDEEKNQERVAWRTKKECRDVVQTSCDLSEETSDLDDQYYARVKVTGPEEVSKWATTGKFFPKVETTFGPPIIKVFLKERSILIKLKGPMRWKTVNSRKEYSMAKYYPQMMYNVSVYNNRTKQTMTYHVSNNSLELGLLDFSSQYCFSARALFSSWDFKTQESDRRCVTTAKDPFMDHILHVTLGCILPSAIILFILSLTGCLVYHYIFGNKPRPPSNLMVPHLIDMQRFCSEVFLLNLNLSITLPSSQQPEEEKPLASTASSVTAPQSYAPQAVPLSGHTEVPMSGSDEDDADVSEQPSPMWMDSNMTSDYGLVVSAEKPLVESSGSEGFRCDDITLLQDDSTDWEMHRQHSQQDINTGLASCKQQCQRDIDTGLASYKKQCQQDMNTGLASYKKQCQQDINTGLASYKKQCQQDINTGLASYKKQCQQDINTGQASYRQQCQRDDDTGLAPRSQPSQQNESTDWTSYREQTQQDSSTGRSSYRQQCQATQTSVDLTEEEDLELDGNIVVDWDPNTRKLHLPLALGFQPEPKSPECDLGEPVDIWSQVFVRQSSEEISEHEDDLTKMENNWALQFNMDK